MVRVSQKKEEDKHGQHQCDRRDQPCTWVSRQSPTKFNCAVSQEFKFHNEKYLTASEEFFLGWKANVHKLYQWYSPWYVSVYQIVSLGREERLWGDENIIHISIQCVSEHFVPSPVVGANNVSANKLSKIPLLEVMYQKASVWGNWTDLALRLSSYLTRCKGINVLFCRTGIIIVNICWKDNLFPGTGAKHIYHKILTISLWDKLYYHPHFSNEETKGQSDL